jgi:hypothetical protein
MEIRLLKSTIEQGWKLIEKPLEKVSKGEFADLKDGRYIATFTDPNGHDPDIRVIISGSRAKLRQVCIDLHTDSCNWNFRPERVEEFASQIRAHLRSHPGKIKWTTVRIPCSADQLSFSIIRGEEGEWLHRASQLLANPANLTRLTFP